MAEPLEILPPAPPPTDSAAALAALAPYEPPIEGAPVDAVEARPTDDLPSHLFTPDEIARAVQELEADTPYPICGFAKIDEKKGELRVCRQRAGLHTAHTGTGRCHLHGGAGKVAAKRSMYHEKLRRYSTLQELFAEQEALRDQHRGLEEEIAMLRSFLSDILTRMRELPAEFAGDDALAIDEENRHMAMVARGIATIEQLRKTLETQHKLDERMAIAITPESLSALLWQMQRIIADEVPDANRQTRIFRRIATEAKLRSGPAA